MGQSVRGAAHLRAGLPNQDAILWVPESGEGPPLILAVSDGHGSPKSFRSHLGASFAVQAMISLVQELVDVLRPGRDLSYAKRTAEERLPRELVRRWQEAVDQHWESAPVTEAELTRLLEERGETGRQQVEENPRIAYGATILAAVVTGDFLLFVQLGDGDILMVRENGEVQRPFPRDPRLIANETTSLCMKNAWAEMRTRFQVRHGEVPAMIMLSTDGYANSFVNEDAFLKVGADLLALLQEEGDESVRLNLPGWLEEASHAGSGDDITVGILYRRDILNTRHAPTAEGGERGSVDASETGSQPESEMGADDKALAGASGERSPGEQERLADEGGRDDNRPEATAPDETAEAHRKKVLELNKGEAPREPVRKGKPSDIPDHV